MEIHRSDVEVVSGELVYVFVHADSRRPVEVPETMRGAIARHERTPVDSR